MCTDSQFVHLHTHSEHSTLDGLAKIRELFETAKSLGQKALAISDHGTMSGLWEAQCVADELDMKMIHACEFYYERENDGKNGHLLVLAKNNEGLLNMYKMQKWASKENKKGKIRKVPVITWEVLKEHSEGLIVTSACLGSTFNQYLMAGEIQDATDWARKFKDVFGEDFYIELQPNQIPEQFTCNQAGLRIARQLGIDIIATNDVHYTFDSDCFPHEVLLAMQTKRKMSHEKRFKFDTDDFWLKSEGEMYETFTGLPEEVVKEAIQNTSKVAEKCNARIEKGHYLPKFYNIPEGQTARQLLVKEIMEGAKGRGMNRNKSFMSDVQHELDVIDRNGYSDYFLIVQDFVTSAKRRGELVGEGRGSGAGSKVAFTTRITEIPPHEYDLLFERFMADGREPDFDVDFSDQQAVFRDLQGKYGLQNVSRIIAYGKMTPKAVARKVLNTFEHPNYIQNAVSKLIDDAKSLKEAFERQPELETYRQKYSTEFGVMERLENVISHTSQHAGGVLIYPELGEHLPLQWDADNEIYVAEFDKYMLEALGHFKFDVLGLETLPVLYNALESIRNSGIDIDLTKIDLEDPKVYEMLSRGDVSGTFQINAQSGKVQQQQPRNFRDLIAINALIRPGVGDWEEYIARRNGGDWFKDPKRPWMHETLGTMTYQEQFLLDAHHLCGWDIAYADKKLRKGKAQEEGLKEQFVGDGMKNGHEQAYMEDIWDEIIASVGDYSFNKSHSASYAMLTYQTAYLKCHYPEHFYASLMSGCKTDGDGQDEISGYIAECKQRGITIAPPDVNDSDGNFVVTDTGIAYRITTIKHVGDSAIEHIRELRPIKSFEDFMERRSTSVAKKNVITNLIKAGAFDFDNPNRAELLWQLDMMGRTKTQIKEGFECPKYDWDDVIKMEWEKEVLGMYLSSHPMEKYGFKPLDDYEDRGHCLQGGEIYNVVQFKDKKGNDMAFVFLNTLFGNVKVLIFASSFGRKDIQEALHIGNIVLVRGRRSGRDVLLDSIEVLESKQTEKEDEVNV